MKYTKQLGAIALASCLLVTPLKAHWADTSMERFATMGVLQGYEGEYRPNDAMTRAEFAVMVNRLLDYETLGALEFTDVEDTWYTGDLLSLAQVGIIKGDGKYLRPSDTLTREEAATIIGRAFFLDNRLVKANFKDEELISKWAVDAINEMAHRGYIQGNTENKFNPGIAITRAEVMTILDNMVGVVYTEDKIYDENKQGITIIKDGKAILEDKRITSDLFISESAEEVILSNIDVEGKVVVIGGEVKINGDVSKLQVVGNAEIYIESGSIQQLVVEDSASESKVFIGEKAKVEQTMLPEDFELEEVTKPNTNSTGSSSGGSGGDGGTTDLQEKVYSYQTAPSFINAPTQAVVLYEDGKIIKGYTLYANGEKIAIDKDEDGHVVIPNSYLREGYELKLQLKDSTEQISLNKGK